MIFINVGRLGGNMEDKAYFPEGYPDEDFRSMLFRYKSRVGATNARTFRYIMLDLFNIDSYRTSTFPRNLCRFVEKTNSFLTPEDIIFNHTFFPLYQPIMPHDIEKNMFEDMLYNQDRVFAGNFVYSLSDEGYKFCPACLISDTSRFGESYIHRVHQFEFVRICPQHEVHLIRECPSCNQSLSDNYNMYQPTSDVCPHCKVLLFPIKAEKSEANSFLLNLAIDCKTLLDTRSHPQHLTSHKYDTLLWLNGYLMGSKKKYKNKAFSEDLISFFKIENVNSLNLSADYLNKRLALTKISFREKKPNPLVHILIMRFLCGSCENFLDYKIPVLDCPIYWGHGPWNCINPLCPNFNEKVISRCKKRIGKINYGRLLHASFECPTCGYQYVINAGESIAHVTNHGDLWRETMIKAASSDQQISEIAQKIGKSVRNTKKQISLAVKTSSWMERNDHSTLKRLEETKEKILTLLSCDSNIKRQDIGIILGKDYLWLRKKDPVWINNNLPERTRGNFKSKDWLKEDMRITKLIIKATDNLYMNNHPKRILSYTILGMLTAQDKGMFINNKTKLPTSIKTLDNLTEPYEAYQVRKIPGTAKYLLKHGRSISISNFCSLDPFINCSDTILKKINEFINGTQGEENSG
jgi:transposase-like protein